MSWSKSVFFLEWEPIYSLMTWLQLVMLVGVVLVAFRAKKHVVIKANDKDDKIDMGVNEDDDDDDDKIDMGVKEDDDVKTTLPVSVNYHFTRQCNYSCGFCFHTAKTSFVLPIEEAKRGLSALVTSGMKKINFSGGEPFLVQKGRFLGELVRFCKEDLDMESVSLITNGSKVTEAWMEEYGYYLDIMAVSCDSFDEKINKKIGRSSKVGSHISGVGQVREWCSRYGVMFKLNTVVNKFNWKEDMTAHIERLNPVRWKVFQCLPIEAENLGTGALRQVTPYLVTESEWTDFLSHHSSVACLVPENNETMQNSYIILDEFMRFLDNTGGSKVPSPSILDVGVEAALDRAGFDEGMFLKRGGKYKWSKGDVTLDW